MTKVWRKKTIILSNMVREGSMEKVQFQKMPRGHRGKSSLGTVNLKPPGRSIQGAMWTPKERQSGNYKSKATRQEHTGCIGRTRRSACRGGVIAVEGGKRWECSCSGHLRSMTFTLSKMGCHWRALNREGPDMIWG